MGTDTRVKVGYDMDTSTGIQHFFEKIRVRYIGDTGYMY